ncbi:uncharacterized protein LOC116340273 [Contarinia nasturtii]|uniref:uncharacterized protein LOC116340273 n=1 Tax=Contarinia nasturtii TaxID=265458 RepID=UPI0012D3E0DB|nr:uncharacterized protein LOC116340273 [Contarinia nasturtii]
MSVEGFHDDCMELINNYCSRNETDFELFCDDWKQMGFHYVFAGHTYQHELLLYTENLFTVLKNIFTSLTTLSERLATLYLMYAMYFKQPTKDFCKFRFTLADWMKMKSFYDAINSESTTYLQARAIFWRLWQGNAFRFVECDVEHYPETIHLHRLGNDGYGDFQKINSTIVAAVKDIQNDSRGLMGAIGTLQIGYNEMKDHLAANMNECAHMQSIDVISDVNSQLNKVRKMFENRYEQRVVKRKARAGPPKRAKDIETTDVESETYTSYSESNDELESISERSEGDDTFDENVNMATRRYNLKKKALEIKSIGLHRLRSTVVETESSPKKKQKVADAEGDEQRPSTSTVKDHASSEIDDDSGNIVIIKPTKTYQRHSKQYISTVRKQFTDCPSEASEEIDKKSTRKRTKL